MMHAPLIIKASFFSLVFLVNVTPPQAQSVITKSEMKNARIDKNGDLVITRSTSSSPEDFDFFEGTWKIHHRKLKTKLSNSHDWIEYEGTNEDFKMLNGIGHTNNNKASIDGEPVEGVSLTLFNLKTKLWSIYWANSKDGVLNQHNPAVGSFEGNIGSFYAKDVFNEKPILVMTQWDKTDVNKVVWSQAFSPDNGKTWEWNWYMTQTRINEGDQEMLRKLLTIDRSLPIPELRFDDAGELILQASPTSSPRDFDLLLGEWKMFHKKLKTRLNNCTEWIDLESIDENYGPILNGIGNTDLYKANFDGNPFEGFTLRLFNPKTKLWSLYWVASNSGALDPPVVGSFENNIGHFFCKDTFNGQSVIVMFRWDKRDVLHPVWSQAFSPDNGKTWEWNWINVSYKIK
jgi:hypothetical protein